MGSLCLSSTEILRCESLTRIENIALIVPTAVEILFSTSLIFTNRGSGREYLLLTVEGWIYLALALLELLSHILPAVRTNLSAFRILDIFIAAASSLPLLFYTTFLFLFTRSELLDALPRRFRALAKILLMIFIPTVVALNEVASFVGITRRAINSGGGQPPTLAIGFNSSSDQTLWTFFTSLTLALFTAYQAVNFTFAFLRLVRVFLQQRRIENTASDEAHLFRGMGWIAGGIKLGAIETVVGFAQGGVGGALTRRILRLLARAVFVVGLIKGVDTPVDFREIRAEMAGRRRSRLRPLISNPRFSTFQRLSPRATQFFNGGQRSPAAAASTSKMPTFLDPLSDFKKSSSSPRRPRQNLNNNQRVTIHFDAASGRAPTLEMRFSALNLPSPAAIVESIKSRPVSEFGLRRSSSYYANSTMTRMTDLQDIPPPPRTAPVAGERAGGAAAESVYAPSTLHNVFATMSGNHTRGRSDFSAISQTSGYRDSVNSLSRSVVTELAAQFPGLPPRVTNLAEKQKQETLSRAIGGVEPEGKESNARSPPVSGGLTSSNSFKRKPAPRASLVLAPAPIDPFDDDATGVAIPTPLPAAEHAYQMSVALRSNPSPTPNTDTGRIWTGTATGTEATQRSGVGYSPISLDPSSFTSPGSERTEDPFKYDENDSYVSGYPSAAVVTGRSRDLNLGARRVSAARTQVSVAPSELPSVLETADENHSGGLDLDHERGKSMETLDISWLKREDKDEWAEEGQEVMYNQEESGMISRARRKRVSRPPLARIKSVGKAPRKYTPAPVKTSLARGSIYIEPIVIPPRQRDLRDVEVVQGGETPSVYAGSQRGMTLRDSDVLGADEEVYRGSGARYSSTS